MVTPGGRWDTVDTHKAEMSRFPLAQLFFFSFTELCHLCWPTWLDYTRALLLSWQMVDTPFCVSSKGYNAGTQPNGMEDIILQQFCVLPRGSVYPSVVSSLQPLVSCFRTLPTHPRADQQLFTNCCMGHKWVTLSGRLVLRHQLQHVVACSISPHLMQHLAAPQARLLL